jgi:hypothetical protein
MNWGLVHASLVIQLRKAGTCNSTQLGYILADALGAGLGFDEATQSKLAVDTYEQARDRIAGVAVRPFP